MANGSPGSPPLSRRLLTLRLRLTLWVVVIAALVQLTVSFVALLYQASSIRALYDDQLQLRADLIADGLPPNPRDVPAEELRHMAQRSSLLVFFDQVRIAVFDMEGRPVAMDPTMPPPDRPDAVMAVIKSGEQAYANWTQVTGETTERESTPHRTFAMPIIAGDSAPAGLILWIATSDRYAQQRVNAVQFAVALTSVAAMLGTVIAGWYIAGIAVRPLEKLRSEVAGLSVGHMALNSDGNGNAPEVDELREELDRAMARIEQGYSAYGRFIANVSHELKTPIAVALTESQVLLGDPQLEEKAVKFAQSISEEMSRLGALIESFLTLTRVREGKISSSLKDFPVNELVMDSVEHCAAFARQNGVTLHPMLIDREEELKVCIDHDLMRTAIDNLIRNAIRFTPVGERIEISAEYNTDKNRVVVSVRDFGPGIPEELLPTLFDRYTQAASESRSNRGTGLGLEIAQGIAELHEGTITVRNLDRGCRFEIELPPISESEQCDDEADENNST